MTQEEMFKYLGAGFAGLMVIYLIISVLDFKLNKKLWLLPVIMLIVSL